MNPYINIRISILDITMNLSIKILGISIRLIISTLLILLNPFCGNSNI